ncbi:MAG: hypothetical protein ACE5KG_04030 [Nitrososphaerales archaeon]
MPAPGLRLLFFQIVVDIGGRIRRDTPSKGDIAISTYDGRAYYAFSSMLRMMNLPYSSRSFNSLKNGVKLVLTTEKEHIFIPHHEVLTLEELNGNLDLSKLIIFKRLYGEQTLIIGLDPGKRIGMVATYGSKRMLSRVFNSVIEVRNSVASLLSYPAVKKIIKIGDGDRSVARSLASKLYSVAGRNAIIEMVDEQGTSIPSRYPTGLKRDIGAAMMIAFRSGIRYEPALLH